MCNSSSISSVATVSNLEAIGDYHTLTLHSPVVASAAQPGQFVMLGILNGASDPLLPRPLAIFSTSFDCVVLLFRVVGAGTRILSALTKGQKVRITGPLGIGFAPAPDSSAHILIGGGTGLASITSLAYQLNENEQVAKKTVLVVGARTQSGLLPKEWQDKLNIRIAFATDDGSNGFHGNALELAKKEAAKFSGAMSIYVAGPIPMMSAVAQWAKEEELACQVSMESRMGCGFGACRGCIIPAKTPHKKTGLMTRAVCVDGPVLEAHNIDWDNMS